MKLNIDIIRHYTKTMPINIEKHPKEDIYIIGYYQNPFYEQNIVWNKVTKQCRGVIVDQKGNVIEKPFDKFWTFRNYVNPDTVLMSEGQVVKIKDEPFRIFEKLDGTLCTLYWIDDKPFLATQRSFTGPKVEKANQLLQNYIESVLKLDRNYTYVFEAIYPETQILVNYKQEGLRLIGKIDKQSGLPDCNLTGLGFETPKEYTEYSHLSRLDQLESLNIENKEGFVIYYESGFMIKIKFPWYKKVHTSLNHTIHQRLHSEVAQLDLQEQLGASINISNHTIWEYLSTGKDLNLLKLKLPDIYRIVGAEEWLDDVTKDFQEKYNQVKSTKNVDLIWEEIKPNQEKIFDIRERIKDIVKHDRLMWKWKERFINTDF